VIRLLNEKRDNPRIVLSTVGAFCIASFQLSIHWATAFIFTWVAYIAVLGFTLIVKKPWKLKLSGVCLLTISSLSYPLLVFFVIPIVFLLWFETGQDWIKLRANTLWALLGITLSAINSLVTNKLLLDLRGFAFNDRVAVISIADLPSQIFWFLSTPVVLSFRGFSIVSPGLLSALLGLLVVNSLILIGFYLRLRSFPETAITWTVLCVFTALSLVPLFFPDQQQIDMRYVTPGAWLIAYILISSVFQIFASFEVGRHLIKREVFAIALITVLFLSINTRYFMVIRPIYLGTNSFINTALESCDQSQIHKGVYVIPRTEEWPSKQYIGMFSQVSDLASSWVPLNAVRVQLGEFSTFRNSRVPISLGDKNSSGCIVDLNTYPLAKK
jgi:hypothetical protein